MTAATAAAGQKAIDLAASDEAALAAAVEGEEVDEAGAGEQQTLLEALLSRLEDAELITHRRLEESAAAKAKEEAEAAAAAVAQAKEAPGQNKKKLAEQDGDGMWAWKSPRKITSGII